jgi:2-polyprenyl-3-methyl-5-hydroxy-6-metoxy-1,4-benzoquinol methylase
MPPKIDRSSAVSSSDRPLSGCPSCDSRRSSFVLQKGDLFLYRCGDCALVFVNPQPRELVDRKYRESYDLASHFLPMIQRKEVLFKPRLSMLGVPSRGERLCDVGCADGQFLALARDAGWRVFGIDLNPAAIAAARDRGLQVAAGSFETLDDLPWGEFDAVTCWDVLEHTPEPVTFAERLVRLLKPRGTLALSTLNWDSLVRKVFRSRWSMIVPDHFTYWNSSSTVQLLERVSAPAVAWQTYGLGRDFVTWVDRWWAGRGRAQTREGKASVRWDARRFPIYIESRVNAVLQRSGHGVGLLILARKAHM